MNPDLVINNKAISRSVAIGNITKTEDRDLYSMYETFSEASYFDTGLLPVDGSGLLSLRQAGNRTQFVYQHAPGVYWMIWGKTERDNTASQITVAQPYRIVIGDHVDGELRGARHFYSPVPITDINQPLYHCNVPNLNCKGYNGTSVGWICLYHKEKYAGLPLGSRIFKTIERASGHEAYNDANMRSTDGARFYQNHYQKTNPEFSYLWEPKAWAKKTDEDGIDWVLNPDLWLPIFVEGIDAQDAHKEGGQLFTLEMAMLGNYKAYYPGKAPDEKELSLMNVIRRKDKKNPSGGDIYNLFSTSFAKAKTLEEKNQLLKQNKIAGITGTLLATEDDVAETWEPSAAIFDKTVQEKKLEVFDNTAGHCVHCVKKISLDDEHYFDSNESMICASCFQMHYGATDCCKQVILLGDQFVALVDGNEKFYCYSCHTQETCDNCGTQYLDQDHMTFDHHCYECATPAYCDNCGNKYTDAEIKKVAAAEYTQDGLFTTKNYSLCISCFSVSAICACGILKPDNTCSPMPGTNQLVCGPCVQFNANNEPVYVSINNANQALTV